MTNLYRIARNGSIPAPSTLGVVTEISLPATTLTHANLPRLRTKSLARHNITIFGYGAATDTYSTIHIMIWLGKAGLNTTEPSAWCGNHLSVDREVYDQADMFGQTIRAYTPSFDKVVLDEGLATVPYTPLGAFATIATGGATITYSDTGGASKGPLSSDYAMVMVAEHYYYVEGVKPKGATYKIPSGRDLMAAGFPDVELSLYITCRRLQGPDLAPVISWRMGPAGASELEFVEVVNAVAVDTAAPLNVTLRRREGGIDVAEPVVVSATMVPSVTEDDPAQQLFLDTSDTPLWVLSDSSNPFK